MNIKDDTWLRLHRRAMVRGDWQTANRIVIRNKLLLKYHLVRMLNHQMDAYLELKNQWKGCVVCGCKNIITTAPLCEEHKQ